VLGIESIDDAASAIRSGHRRTLDTGLVDDETFVLNASTGYDAAVMQRVDDSAKRWGRLGYFVTGLRTLSTQRPAHVRVSVDGDVFYEGRAMTVMVTNVGERGSAEFTVAPGSAPDDGQLDVVVQRSDTAPAMLRMIWALQRGRHPRAEDLLVAHGRSIDVRWAAPVPAQCDGDATGRLVEALHRVDPGSLTVCVPAPD
jgi:diacylglycerol kinase (ATP)